MTPTSATAFSNIVGAILAAGASSRMGTPKALLPIGPADDCFLTRLSGVFRDAGLGSIVAVVGPGAEAVRRRADEIVPPIRVLENPDPSRGQLSSLLIALDAAEAEEAGGLLVTLVDVPLVEPNTIRQLLDTWRRTRAPIVRPERHGRHGHPVIFDKAVFGDLHRADPALGARSVVRAHAAAIVDVPVEDEGPFVDIDTPEDYRRWVGR